MEVKIYCGGCVLGSCVFKLGFAIIYFGVLLSLLCFGAALDTTQEHVLHNQELESKYIGSHSCIHDQIIEQRKRPGGKVFSVTSQVYEVADSSSTLQGRGRSLLSVAEEPRIQRDEKQPIRIYLNYDAVGHSSDRDCRGVGGIVKLGEPPGASYSGGPSCDPHGEPPVYGDCWYNCTLDDIAVEDKRRRLHKSLRNLLMAC
ncbi:hypothetical protein Leryth_012936 [Lithospermum erythrorhizon]|nr:hypothetical protein Leryth_012936 [Lithospermum erythrorhizon]